MVSNPSFFTIGRICYISRIVIGWLKEFLSLSFLIWIGFTRTTINFFNIGGEGYHNAKWGRNPFQLFGGPFKYW